MDEIRDLLLGVGLDAKFGADKAIVIVAFRNGDQTRDVLVFDQGDSGYYTAAAFVAFVVPGDLTRATLLSLLRESGEVRLAKLEFLETETDDHKPQTMLLATSDCSADTPTGAKLRNRIQACAELAERTERILSMPTPLKKGKAPR